MRVKGSPVSRVMDLVSKLLMRISGPFVSKMVATGRPMASRTDLSMFSRARCSVWLPWEKLNRAASMPVRMRVRIISSLSTAGPRVQIIFVLLIGVTSFGYLILDLFVHPYVTGKTLEMEEQIFTKIIFFQKKSVRSCSIVVII